VKSPIFNHLSFGLLGSRRLQYGGLRFEYSYQTHYYKLHTVHLLLRW